MNGLRVSEIDAITGVVIAERNALTTQGPPSPCLDCAVGEGLGIKGDRKKLSVRSVDGAFVTDDGLRPARVSTYDMRGDWSRAFDVLVGLAHLTDADLAQDTDNAWQDAVSVDGHTGSGWTLDYLYHRFGREGLDGDNGPVVAIIHPVDRADFFTVPSSVASLFHLNAFYCGSVGHLESWSSAKGYHRNRGSRHRTSLGFLCGRNRHHRPRARARGHRVHVPVDLSGRVRRPQRGVFGSDRSGNGVLQG